MMRQEAHEKAFEYQVQGQRRFEEEKAMELKKGQAKQDKDFQDQIQKLNIDQKIQESKKLNETRIKKMICRNEQLSKLKVEVKAKIMQDLAGDSDLYRETVQKMIVQGMIKLLEKNVELKVRESD